MELKEAIKKLEDSGDFREWRQKNKDTFFSYALNMIEEKKEQPWSLGYYHQSTDKVVTFIVDDQIDIQPEEEIFKKPESNVNAIEMEKIGMDFSTLLEKARDFTKKTYPKELISRTIAILQNLEGYGTIWNITFITHSFNTINIKASPTDAKVLDNKIESIMGMIKK